MGFRKVDETRAFKTDEDIIADVPSSWASWHIASLAAVLAVIAISALSLLQAG